MDAELIKSIFKRLQTNPKTTEDELKAFVISQFDQTEETITEWLKSACKGLHESLVIDKPTFLELKNKSIEHADMPIDKVIEILKIYFDNHPLQYRLQQQLDNINEQIAGVEKLPDKILTKNNLKFSELEILQGEKYQVEILILEAL